MQFKSKDFINYIEVFKRTYFNEVGEFRYYVVCCDNAIYHKSRQVEEYLKKIGCS